MIFLKNREMESSLFFTQTANSMVSLGLKEAGYTILQIDDCWMLPGRNARGQQVLDPSKFPGGGISALAEHVSAFQLGIYTAMGNFTCAQKAGSCGAFQPDTALYGEWNLDYLKP